MAKKKAKKKATKKTAARKSTSARFSIVDELLAGISEIAEVTRQGDVRIKKTDLKKALESVLEQAARKATAGERVTIPALGSLTAKKVEARKARKGINPFTGEPTTFKARPESRKPRMSFNKATKEIFANKRNW
ncbi:MAG: HU family DNA-binding protein [Leptospiraceae bacterium]|nr:HU family DNA-binding protein [Leptospiraceae bacterium]